MIKKSSLEFANQWIADWNSHDLMRILSHYTEDVEITTPMIKIALGQNVNSLIGKEAVSEYWKNAMSKFPDLHFQLIDVTEGVNSIAIYYQTIMNKRAIEVMFFDQNGKVNKMIALYNVD